MSDKNFVGTGWLKTFNNGGSVINCALKKDDLDLLPVDDYGCIRISVVERREPDSKSKATHYVCEDTFRAKKGNAPVLKPESRLKNEPDLPF